MYLLKQVKKKLEIINKQKGTLTFDNGFSPQYIEMDILAQRMQWEIAILSQMLRDCGVNLKDLEEEDDEKK